MVVRERGDGGEANEGVEKEGVKKGDGGRMVIREEEDGG